MSAEIIDELFSINLLFNKIHPDMENYWLESLGMKENISDADKLKS
jgi:hypothetical protein